MASGLPLLGSLGGLAQAGSKVALVAADAKSVLGMFTGGGPQWGIFDAKNKPVLAADNVMAVDFRREFRISEFPVEQGGFASYDKVAEPFDVRVTLTASGKGSFLSSILSGGAIGNMLTGANPSLNGRQAFLKALDGLLSTTALFQVATPEASYPGVNIVHCDYRREARSGVSLLQVEVWCREVRVTTAPTTTGVDTIGAPSATPAVTGPASPAGADKANGGTVQAQPATAAQVASLPAAPAAAGGSATAASNAADSGSGAGAANVTVKDAYAIPAGADPSLYFGGQYVGPNASPETIAAIRASHGVK